MNKNFIKSMTSAIAGLTLISACSMFDSLKGSHKCSSANCSSKKTEESHKCGAANGCAAAKTTEVKTNVDAKASEKTVVKNSETKTKSKNKSSAKKTDKK